MDAWEEEDDCGCCWCCCECGIETYPPEPWQQELDFRSNEEKAQERTFNDILKARYVGPVNDWLNRTSILFEALRDDSKRYVTGTHFQIPLNFGSVPTAPWHWEKISLSSPLMTNTDAA